MEAGELKPATVLVSSDSSDSQGRGQRCYDLGLENGPREAHGVSG
jgi:hypothetical protein